VGKGDPVQFASPTKARVFVHDKNGAKVETDATIPEGWWAIDDQDE